MKRKKKMDEVSAELRTKAQKKNLAKKIYAQKTYAKKAYATKSYSKLKKRKVTFKE